jgi:alkanesulfonate monooxygenase SsuD/methylene tetrahydromethanopterin reductase-like flavin-dependent oxidoreductase (luciferase family)
VPSPAIPVGINLTSMGVQASWWLSTARLLEGVGFAAVWCWDHFVSRGRLADPVLECWTTLSATAAVTEHVRVGSFVSNVMNRHPAVLARMAATVHELSEGRLDVGVGIGGHPAEHEAYGIDFPPPPERVARLEETVDVLRKLWTGGPVDYEGRYYRLSGAYAHPVPSPAPRIIVGGEKPGGARLAGRIGDAWAMNGAEFDRLLPIFEESLAAAGRSRAEVDVIVAIDLERGVPPWRQPLFDDLAETAERWRQRGADELVFHWVRPRDIPALLHAADRAGWGREDSVG